MGRRAVGTRFGFAARLAIGISVLVGVACVAQTWLVSAHALGQVRDQLVSSSRRLVAAVAAEAREPMEVGDVATLRGIAARSAAQQDTIYCRFFDRAGLLLAVSGPATGGAAAGLGPGPIETGSNRWAFSAPVRGMHGDDRRIGTVEIGVSTEALTRLRARIGAAAIGLAALVVLVAVLAGVAMARAITGPLTALARAADAIADGDLGAIVRVRRRDEIGVLGASFNAMVASVAESRAALVEKVAELERVNQLKSEFVATVSHELRTPLNVILGYLEMLREGVGGALTEGQRELIERVERYSVLQLEMITDVLDFSRLASGKVTCRVERFSLLPLLEDVLALHATRATERGLALRLAVSDDVPVLETDRTKIEEIVRNLVGNALKFTDGGGVTVSAACGSAADSIRIAVADTGCGIDDADLPHLFEPFYQVGSSSTRTTGGVGLGLSIVQQLVTILGGVVRVESVVGHGTIMHVELPSRLRGADDGATVAEEALDAAARNVRTVRVAERPEDRLRTTGVGCSLRAEEGAAGERGPRRRAGTA